MASMLTSIFGHMRSTPGVTSRKLPRVDQIRTYFAGSEPHVVEGVSFQWDDTDTWQFPHQGVSSSNLKSVAYDGPHNLMQIEFMQGGRNSGNIYNYTGVPEIIYHGLMAAPSKGQYHHRWIRCEYDYSDLSGKSRLLGCANQRDSRLRGPASPILKGKHPVGLLSRIFGKFTGVR